MMGPLSGLMRQWRSQRPWAGGRRSVKVTANGIVMNYELAGQGNALALVHGAGDNLHMWYNQVPAFSSRYCVLTYDVRGHGGTELPEGACGLEVLAEDLHQLLRALNMVPAAVLGYSMGGRIALELAVRHPEAVRALVLANSAVGAVPRPPQAEERRRRLLSLLEARDLETVALEMTTTSFSPGFGERDPEAFRRYREVKLQNDARSFGRLWGGLAAAPPADPARVSCPTLVIAGEQDQFMPVESAQMTQQAIPGSRLEFLPTGHAAAIEAPAEFNRIVLDFLALAGGGGDRLPS